MPRDANGNFSLYQPGNPVATGTVIESAWANSTLEDIAAEITDSLSRSGKGGLTGPFKIVDKEGNIPGLAFSAEPTSGLKRQGTADVRMQVDGVDAMQFGTTAQYARSGGTLKQIVVEEAGQTIMRGGGGLTRLFFYNSGVPTGWTLANPDGNVRALMVGGTGGSIGGTDNPSSILKTVNITIAGTTEQTITQKTIQSGTGINVVTNNHVHDFSGSDSDSISIAPRYAMGVVGQLNA